MELEQSLCQAVKDSEKREALKRIIRVEEEKVEQYRTDPIFKGLDQTPYWDWMEAAVDWHLIRKLLLSGIVKAFGGRRKYYVLTDRELTKQVLDEFEKIKPQAFEFREKVTRIPDDLFSVVVGYDDVKKLFEMSLKSEKPTHILMVGPPASSKTVFLLECGRLKNAFYLLGGSTTKVGLIDQLFNLQPQYILLDEADKMNKEDYTALLSLMETSIVKEVKHNKTREMVLPAKVYAACNVERYLPPELLSRFQFKLHFKPYTDEEYLEVSRRVLVQREGLTEELARYISSELVKFTKDVRDAIGIARLSKTKENVDFLIKLKKKYM